jgi:hypothetical protein
MPTTKTRVLDFRRSTDRAFVHLLVNTLLVSVINFTLWFAVTFWVFLETKSVLATGMVGRRVLGGHGPQRHLVRQHGRPPSQEDHDAGLRNGLARVLCRGFHAVPVDAEAGLHPTRRA